MDKIVLELGAKYYQYDDNDNLHIYRIYRHNESEVKLYDCSDKNSKMKMSFEELRKNYIKLKPAALINFCIAKLNNKLNDVIVSMHKYDEISSGEPTPYCVCRQNITDVFANQIRTSEKLYVGCCMSLDTCPQDVDYRMMIACNGIIKSMTICTYMDDKFEDIIELVRTKDYDAALEALYTDHIDYTVKQNPALSALRPRLMKLDSHDGYCRTLRTLLTQNNFMYDYYQAFNIIPINEEVIVNEDNTVCDKVREIIEDLYQINITSTLCIEYGYDINFTDINNSYVLVMDNKDKLYIIAYVSSGSKSIDLSKTESAENIEALANTSIGDNKSIKDAYNHIRIYKDKYK